MAGPKKQAGKRVRTRVVMKGKVQVPVDANWREPTKAELDKLKEAFRAELVATLGIQPTLVLDRVKKSLPPSRKRPPRRPRRKP